MSGISTSLPAGLTIEASTQRRGARLLFAPWSLIAAAVLPCLALLSVPLSLAAGSFYWDIYAYLDGAHRVLRGQTPSVDFFAPVGPISYWLLAALMKVFPNGQPLLLANWCMLAVSAPAMAALASHVDRRSRPLALGLIVPFLIFQILPVNVEQFTFYLGFDGYGIYNRHSSGLLYVLVAMLVFARDQRLMTLLLAGLCLGLFLLKITGFVVALGLCAFGLAAGRVSWRAALGSAVIFTGALLLLELGTGVVSAYLRDLATLLALNSDTLLFRVLRAGSMHAESVGGIAVLLLALAWRAMDAPNGVPRRALRHAPIAAAAARILDRDELWIVVVATAALLFETQNTGGHAFLFLWPVLLRLVVDRRSRGPGLLVAILVAAIALPPLCAVLARTARTLVIQAQYGRLDLDGLKGLGRVTQRRETLQNAAVRQNTDAATVEAQALYFESGGRDDVELFASPEFQILWLRAAAEAVDAIRSLERRAGIQFRSVLNVGFVNPFPYLLDRDAPLLVAIGADPTRTTPRPDAATLASIRDTDLLVFSHCPMTAMSRELRRLYAPALDERVPVRLSPCWTAYPRPALGPMPLPVR